MSPEYLNTYHQGLNWSHPLPLFESCLSFFHVSGPSLGPVTGQGPSAYQSSVQRDGVSKCCCNHGSIICHHCFNAERIVGSWTRDQASTRIDPTHCLSSSPTLCPSLIPSTGPDHPACLSSLLSVGYNQGNDAFPPLFQIFPLFQKYFSDSVENSKISDDLF